MKIRYKCEVCHIECEIQINEGACVPLICPYGDDVKAEWEIIAEE